MAITRFSSIGKILLNTGLSDNGHIVRNTTLYSGNEFFLPGSPPAQFSEYNVTGINIPNLLLFKNMGVGEEKTLFTLKNGSEFLVRKLGSTQLQIIGQKNNIEYGIMTISGGLAYYLTIMNLTSAFFNIIIADDSNIGLALSINYIESGNVPTVYFEWYIDSSATSQTTWTTLLSDQPFNVDDPYCTNNDENDPGGYGPGDYSSEVETPPSLPSLSAAQVGFVSLWNPTQQEMQDLANYLWTGTFDLTNFKKLFTDPMECVLSVGIIPITPTRKQSGGTDVKEEIVFGGSSHSGVNAYPVTEQFYIVDMGSLHITGQSQSAMDYAPYSKASIYLPYCGTYALDVDEIMDSDISLEYHIDIYTGACVAYLTINGHVNSDGNNVNAIMYQFTGNVLASIPITGNDHSQFIQSMLFMGASIAATVASSGAGAPAIEGAAASGDVAGAGMALNAATAGSAINTVMSMKPNVLHSGNLSSTAGLLGGQKPFITMTWSNLCRPEDEYKLAGMPLHRSGTLSDFSGFTVVSACHMENILCTDAERSMIEQALAKGVII